MTTFIVYSCAVAFACIILLLVGLLVQLEAINKNICLIGRRIK